MTSENTIPVWDPWVRLFHWILAAAILSLFVLDDRMMTLHILIGCGVLGLLTFRLIWGWMGPEHARFADFVRSPVAVLSYLYTVIRCNNPPRYLGHNPAGGMMVILLMITLFLTALFGLLALKQHNIHWLEEGHEWLANGLLVLIALHLLGVLFTSLHDKENLVTSMITGRKKGLEENNEK